jgi:hypothetical protein
LIEGSQKPQFLNTSHTSEIRGMCVYFNFPFDRREIDKKRGGGSKVNVRKEQRKLGKCPPLQLITYLL